MDGVTADGEPFLSFSFDGAGWLHPFHYGVGLCLSEYLDVVHPGLAFFGISSGALVSVGLAFGLDMREYFVQALTCLQCCRYNPFRMADCAKHVLERVCPTSDERWRSLRSLVVNVSQRRGLLFHRYTSRSFGTFESREHGISILRASCTLPLIGGLRGYPVRTAGRVERYYDGGLGHKFVVPEPSGPSRVVHVSPWSPVRPGWITSGVAFPDMWIYLPREEDVLWRIHRLGYLRAAEFLAGEGRAVQKAFARSDAPPLPPLSEIREEIDGLVRDFLAMGAGPEPRYNRDLGRIPIHVHRPASPSRTGLGRSLVH